MAELDKLVRNCTRYCAQYSCTVYLGLQFPDQSRPRAFQTTTKQRGSNCLALNGGKQDAITNQASTIGCGQGQVEHFAGTLVTNWRVASHQPFQQVKESYFPSYGCGKSLPCACVSEETRIAMYCYATAMKLLLLYFFLTLSELFSLFV